MVDKPKNYQRIFLAAAIDEIEKASVAKYLARNSRKRAKQLKIEHTVSWKDIPIPDVCPITLRPMQRELGQAGPNSYSLDRIDPDKGYVKGNVLVMSWQANRAKCELTLPMLERLVEYLKQRG